MTLSLALTPAALQHLDDIADYTYREWGKQQMAVYLAAIDDRFKWLAEHPDLGRVRPELGDNIRSYREGSHLIFYRASQVQLEVLAVLHQSRDLKRYFGR